MKADCKLVSKCESDLRWKDGVFEQMERGRRRDQNGMSTGHVAGTLPVRPFCIFHTSGTKKYISFDYDTTSRLSSLSISRAEKSPRLAG